jgi:hypothetical protein
MHPALQALAQIESILSQWRGDEAFREPWVKQLI